jgi:hypothetical protein
VARRKPTPPPDYDRVCGKGHDVPAGTVRCLVCRHDRVNARERERTQARRGVELLATGAFPPMEVLEGAACSIELAYLFDPAGARTDGITDNATRSRHRAAKRVCAGCPVRRLCYDDAYANKRAGVYGGTVFDHGFWVAEGAKRAKALVQPVQDVPDSAAC